MKKAKLSLESLTPFIARIEKLTPLQRVLIYVGTFVVIIGVGIYFVHLPKLETKSAIEQDIDGLNKNLAGARRSASQLPRLKKAMDAAEVEYKTVMAALPEKKEIPTLLTSISNCGTAAGLNVLLFQPGAEHAKNFYAEIPVAITVHGSFNDVANFFDRVASLNRIVNLRDITISPAADRELNVSCTAVTYRFIQPKKRPKKKRK